MNGQEMKQKTTISRWRETICWVQFEVKLEKFPRKIKIRSQFFYSSLISLISSSSTTLVQFHHHPTQQPEIIIRGWKRKEVIIITKSQVAPRKKTKRKKIITSTISFFHVPPSPGRFNWPLAACVFEFEIWPFSQPVSQPGPRLMECDGETTTIDTLCSL